MAVRVGLSLICIPFLAYQPSTANVRTARPSYAISLKAGIEGHDKFSVDPLSGIPAVFVSSSRLSPGAERLRLSRANLERLIEDDLITHHIPLRPTNDAEREKPPRYARLSLDVRVTSVGKTVAYDVTLSLLEMLLRQHNRDVVISVPIWRSQELGIAPADQARGEVIEAIHSAVEDFSVAFTAAH